MFCKEHQNSIFTVYNINQTFCSGCKNPCVYNLSLNQCDNCIYRKKQLEENNNNNNNTRVYINQCNGFKLTTNERCTNDTKSIEQNYCGKHIVYGNNVSLLKSNHEICSNFVRGCKYIKKIAEKDFWEDNDVNNDENNDEENFIEEEENNKKNAIEDVKNINENIDNKIIVNTKNNLDKNGNEIYCIDMKELKRCKDCKKNDRENDAKKKSEKKQIAIDFNEKNNLIKMCQICNCECNLENFKNNKCKKCYDKFITWQTADKVKTINTKIKDIRHSATRRNIFWDLENEDVEKIINSRCYYCSKLVAFNGIDRVDSNKGYTKDNCVPCCKKCNFMKCEYSVEHFLNIVCYLLSFNAYIEELPNPEHAKYFTTAIEENVTYSRFCCDAKQREKNVEISEETHKLLTSRPCKYCGLHGLKGAKGIDRIDSSIGYVLGNVVPCCKTCNLFKNEHTIDVFFTHLLTIYNYKFLGITNTDLTIQEKILSLCKETRVVKPHKCLQDKSFYENLVYNNTDIEQLKKIKVVLDFVDGNNLKQDIWNYYRRSVSSFTAIEGGSLIGRQIYILVKDETTQKYLGIMSLSSDFMNLQSRDDFIGWSQENKTLRLNNLLNLSTCVPLQPFGFNFNGGKLLTSLAFSSEVLQHYKKKYGDNNGELLGITTTSLYGKSIQYDRLPCIKFMGFTHGNSVKEIPSKVTKLCCDYLKEECNYNYPLRKKFIIIQCAFDKLNISKELYLKDNPKGVYFGYTYKQSKCILNNEMLPTELNTDKTFNCIKTSEETFNWWLNRWAIQRATHLNEKKLGK